MSIAIAITGIVAALRWIVKPADASNAILMVAAAAYFIR